MNLIQHILTHSRTKYNRERGDLMQKKRKEKPAPYDTYALADKDRRDPKTGADRPSEQAVKEAKDWVDANHL